MYGMELWGKAIGGVEKKGWDEERKVWKFSDFSSDGIIHLPRQVSCTINRTLVNWGRVGNNVPQNLHKYYGFDY